MVALPLSKIFVLQIVTLGPKNAFATTPHTFSSFPTIGVAVGQCPVAEVFKSPNCLPPEGSQYCENKVKTVYYWFPERLYLILITFFL